MLQTINGFDLLLVLIIMGLTFIVSIQKEKLADNQCALDPWHERCDRPNCVGHKPFDF